MSSTIAIKAGFLQEEKKETRANKICSELSLNK